jgi:hypothetical protein
LLQNQNISRCSLCGRVDELAGSAHASSGNTRRAFMQNANGDLSQISDITGGASCTSLITLSSADLNNTAVYWGISSAGTTRQVDLVELA